MAQAQKRRHSRLRRAAFREDLRTLRYGALRDGVEVLDGLRLRYRYNNPTTNPDGSAWTRRVLARERRVRHALDRQAQEFYDRKLIPEGTDLTPVVWSVAPAPTMVISLKAVRPYCRLEGIHVYQLMLAEDVQAICSPRWVFDLVNREEFTTTWLYGPAQTKRQCAELDGADPDTVLRLFEPGGQGPLSDLRQVVAIAKLL